MEQADQDWMMIRMVGGWVFLLVPAHLSWTKGRKTVVVVLSSIPVSVHFVVQFYQFIFSLSV